jgi:hypothetical protein
VGPNLEREHAAGGARRPSRGSDFEAAHIALLRHLDTALSDDERAAARDRIGIAVNLKIDDAVTLSLRAAGDFEPG